MSAVPGMLAAMDTLDDFSLDDPLPACPDRGVTQAQVAAAQAGREGETYPYGMTTALGAARVHAVVAAVEEALRQGLGRDVALLALLGGCVRLERDGHGEYSDTVVRESIVAALEPACEQVGVPAFTDAEVNEVALLLSQRAVTAYSQGALRAMTRTS